MDIKQTIKHAREFPYHGRKPKDNAELAALAVLAALEDRRGVGHELTSVDDDDKRVIVESLAAIIRTATGQP
jgi:hypothetical protein